jgi:ribosome maturation protein Sdo1
MYSLTKRSVVKLNVNNEEREVLIRPSDVLSTPCGADLDLQGQSRDVRTGTAEPAPCS